MHATAGAGRKAGFVPPFVNKALAAQEGGEESGPLSPKTLEMLAGAPHKPGIYPHGVHSCGPSWP